MKLLIVEDEPNLLSVLRKGFTENNFEVSVCLDGETALEIQVRNEKRISLHRILAGFIL